jgi:hypothetical protein
VVKEDDLMPIKLQFDCDALFPRVGFYVREADGYIEHWELVEKLMYDALGRTYAPMVAANLGR